MCYIKIKKNEVLGGTGMKKKIFAILLSFTIVAGMMPDNTLADDAASMQHDHCFCGMNEYSQGHDHDSLISWKPLS